MLHWQVPVVTLAEQETLTWVGDQISPGELGPAWTVPAPDPLSVMLAVRVSVSVLPIALFHGETVGDARQLVGGLHVQRADKDPPARRQRDIWQGHVGHEVAEVERVAGVRE